MARDLTASLQARLNAFHQGDHDPVLEDRALADAYELMRRSQTDDGVCL